ncbi:hypothetical protein D3C84_1134220 [compost metagenome]
MLSQCALLVAPFAYRLAKYSPHIEAFDANPALDLGGRQGFNHIPNSLMRPSTILCAQWGVCQNLPDQLIRNLCTILLPRQPLNLETPLEQCRLVNLLLRLAWERL